MRCRNQSGGQWVGAGGTGKCASRQQASGRRPQSTPIWRRLALARYGVPIQVLAMATIACRVVISSSTLDCGFGRWQPGETCEIREVIEAEIANHHRLVAACDRNEAVALRGSLEQWRCDG